MQFLAKDYKLRVVEVPIAIRYLDKPKRNVLASSGAIFRKAGRNAVANVKIMQELCTYSSISLLYIRTRWHWRGDFGISGGSGKASST